MNGTTPPPRRRRLAITLGVLIVLVAAVWMWAALNTDDSLYARAIMWRKSDTGDWERFPARIVAASPDPVTFENGALPPGALATIVVPSSEQPVGLDDALEESGTTAFIVLQNDRMLTERYYNDSYHDDTQTSFSTAKSFVSTLVGIAIDEGFIASLDDPVTDYIPELAQRDERMGDITLRHLVSMSSGLRYVERGMPWTDGSRTYYSPDLRAAALSVEVVEPPGTTWVYNNYNPLLLGMVLERATGMSVAGYLETRLWQPMGAEADGSWSLDSETSAFEKMESGINGRAVDFLKLGWLFLNGGRNGDLQVVSQAWVEEATRVDTTTDPADHYQYFWWIDETHDAFYAAGNHGQFIYVVPDQELVILRMGDRFGYEIEQWVEILGGMADQLGP